MTLGVLPLFHIFGLNVVLGLTLPRRVDRAARRALRPGVGGRGHRCATGSPSSPARRRCGRPGRTCPDTGASAFRTVRIATSGAARLPAEVAERMQSRFGVVAGRGLRPHRGVAGGHHRRPASSTGRARSARRVPGVEVRLVDADGDDVLVGDAGEIWVQGPERVPGLLERPRGHRGPRSPPTAGCAPATSRWSTTTASSTSSTGPRTSSSCRASTCSRPRSRRCCWSTRPSSAAAVVGVPHPHSGEAVKAYVVVAAGHVDRGGRGHRAAASDRLARYKCPEKVMFVDELPQGLAGKVLRRALR